MEECAPTVRGEIKKARVGNYDFVSGIFEFVDNALDAGSEKILINVRNRGESGHPHKVLISDNNAQGIGFENITRIFSWTYERDRANSEIGEYGTGFKTAAVNLGEKLTLLTKDGRTGRCFQAVADWHDMSESNRWGPRVQEIDEEIYGDTHPYSNGTTFIIEGLRYELIPLSGNTEVTTSMQLVSNLYQQVVYAYRYLLKTSGVDIVVKGSYPGTKEMSEKRALDHAFFHKNLVENTQTSKIRVYHDQSQFYRVFFQRENSPKWEMIQFLEKRKNGSNHLKSVEFKESMFSPLRLVEEMRFCTKQEDPDLFSGSTCCLMDILHAGRVVGQNINLRGAVPECPVFIKHELWYTSYTLNALLSIQYNKKNNGMRENDLTYTLEFLHQIHEKEARKETVDAAAAEKKQTRKNFTSQTKIQILTRQECRDSIMDFVLKETILPMDYDHKNGENSINSVENCQALSVITHAVKTRYPDIYNKIEANRDDKIAYIVNLLNCITRSKHFGRALSSGKIRIDRTNIPNEGLFRIK